jgi:hypothetical protein
LGVLALRGDRDPTGKIGLEGAAAEILGGAGDGEVPAHTAIMVPPAEMARSEPPLGVALKAAAGLGFRAAQMKVATGRRASSDLGCQVEPG